MECGVCHATMDALEEDHEEYVCPVCGAGYCAVLDLWAFGEEEIEVV